MRVIFARQWRMPKIMVALLLIEFPLTVACLALMGISDPNTYRTKLWQNGSDAGFNSDPSEILYSYANYRPIHVPLVWSSYMTRFNVVISVISMFVLLVKSSMYVLHVFLPFISILAHALLVALYSVSIYNQTAPDMTDLTKPSPGMPWYLSKGCSYATPGNKGYCEQARASFAVVVVMTALFVVYLGYSIWNAFPTEQEKAERRADWETDMEMKKLSMYGDGLSKDERREQNREIFLNLPKTPNTPGFGGLNPMTPRTHAFTQLNGGPSRAGPSTSRPQVGPSNSLPLREFSNAPKRGQGIRI